MFKECFLNFYVMFPFITALTIGVLMFIRNPIYLRKISEFFFVFQFINSVVLYFSANNAKVNLFGFDFSTDNLSLLLLLCMALVFLVISFNFKFFILKLHRLFYASVFTLIGLVNNVVLSDSVYLVLMSIFWIFIMFYFIQRSYASGGKVKNRYFYILGYDVFLFILSVYLISNNFLKYFLLNDLAFTFSNMITALERVDETSGVLAFIGFAILIFRFLNCLPFSYAAFLKATKSNPMVFFVCQIFEIIVALILCVKVNAVFVEQIAEYQGEILLILFINFVYYALLSLRQDNVLKFLASNLNVNLLAIILSLVIIGKDVFSIIVYGFIVLLISFVLMGLIIISLVQKFKSSKIEDFLNIKYASKPVFTIAIISFLTFAKIPLLALFKPILMCLLLLFSADFDSGIVNGCLYLIVAGLFINSLANLNILQRILFDPIKKPKGVFSFSFNQIVSFSVLILVLVLLTFGVSDLFLEFESDMMSEF